ncbi:MAG: glycosyltransferase family 4 protein [Oscillospiraceae bacterium]|nr:glycosyltransferase family 4 protein [Oscillospiraceae bacterium]
MKKVLIIDVHDASLYGFRKEFIIELIKENIQVHFSVPYGPKVEYFKKLGAIYHPIKLNRRGKNPFAELRLIFSYRKLIKQVKPDLIVTRAIKPNIYAGNLARMMHIPYVTLVTGLGSGLNEKGISTKTIKMLYRRALKKSACVFFQNEGDQSYFKKVLDKNNVKYVLTKGSGVNLDEYRANMFEREEKDRGDKTNFLYIARIQKEKGIEEYLEAAQYFVEKSDDCVFNILGPFEDAKYMEIIENLSNEGIVQYLGVSEDTRTEMLKTDCIVMPTSYHEGMCNVILEGAAMGLPVIASDIYGCREAIEDKQTGFLCQPRSAESLIRAIEKFLALSVSNRSRMGMLGREKMVDEFDREKVVKQYMDAVHELI